MNTATCKTFFLFYFQRAVGVTREQVLLDIHCFLGKLLNLSVLQFLHL